MPTELVCRRVVNVPLATYIKWAGMPSTAINSAIQGKAENAGLATLNFLVNGLTLGFADLMEDETPIIKEDFGQTRRHQSA